MAQRNQRDKPLRIELVMFGHQQRAKATQGRAVDWGRRPD